MDDADKGGYYTLQGFRRQKQDQMTAAMEDYLEMICRLSAQGEPARVNKLARLLHVRPSSVSKMAVNLRDAGWVSFIRYGEIIPTEKGAQLGAYLLRRHQVVYEFLCRLNGDREQLEQTERIEHFLEPATVDNLARLTGRMGGRGG